VVTKCRKQLIHFCLDNRLNQKQTDIIPSMDENLLTPTKLCLFSLLGNSFPRPLQISEQETSDGFVHHTGIQLFNKDLLSFN
jgi:hypothetical protein